MGAVTDNLGHPHPCVSLLSWPPTGERIYPYIRTLADCTTVQYPAIAVFTVDMSQGFHDPWLRQRCEQLCSHLWPDLIWGQCAGYPPTL